MMSESFPTAFLFFAGAALLVALPQGRLRAALLLAIPVLAAWQVWSLPEGALLQVAFFGLELELMRVDRLSRVFALSFTLAAFLGNLYAWHLRDTVQQLAALLYAGAAIGAVFAGDLVALFFYWEGTAIASVFLIWARRSEGAYHTGMRYLIVLIGSGVILLAGTALYWRETGSLAFEGMTLASPGVWLIFLGFGIKAAFPLLHNWMQDAYPAATVTGTVILSAFTTKLAIYALARGFAGTEVLIYIGAVMAVFPVFFAMIENNLRRVLAYSLNSQLGFMVVGIGIGSEMALNGTVSHAFAGTLYFALLFMAVGAVMTRTGSARVSDLGGLYRTMPRTAMLCLVGAASISAFPLFSGFVTKSIIVDEAAAAHMGVVWAALLFASVGALANVGIRLPFSMFFSRDRGLRPREAPAHMLAAMAIAAALSVLIGIYPDPLYALLPYPVDYQPFTKSHVIGQLQLLLFGLLGFVLLMRAGIRPPERPAVNLDSDWLYRRAGPWLLARICALVSGVWNGLGTAITRQMQAVINYLYRSHGPEGRIAHIWPTGAMVLWLAIILGITLVVSYAS